MALTDDLVNIERRLSELENSASRIRIGFFTGITPPSLELTNRIVSANVQGGEGGRIDFNLWETDPNDESQFVYGHVRWTENDISTPGVAIIITPRLYLRFPGDRVIPPLPAVNDQALLFFVGGHIFALPVPA